MGVTPGETKKRRGWLGSAMPYPRVIPHSDAAGVVDAVGEGVDARLACAFHLLLCPDLERKHESAF